MQLRRRLELERRPAAPLARAQLVDHTVLRDLEEPRRELAPAVEPWQRLVDPHEDFLADVLRERPVAREHPRHIVEDRPVILPHDDRERALVASARET